MRDAVYMAGGVGPTRNSPMRISFAKRKTAHWKVISIKPVESDRREAGNNIVRLNLKDRVFIHASTSSRSILQFYPG